LMSGAPVCEKDFFKSFMVSIIRRFVLNRLSVNMKERECMQYAIFSAYGVMLEAQCAL